MKKFTISLGIFLIFAFLLILGGCQEGTITPSTPTPAPTLAPTTGSISGIVTEKGTGTPLDGVTITVDGTATTTTASDGSYSLTNLSPGFHTLKFEKVGYKTQTANVNVVAGSDTPKAIEMENTMSTTEIFVTEDTYIAKGGTNHGNSSYVAFGAEVLGDDRRMLFKFPNNILTIPVPSSFKVISAKLKLYKGDMIPVGGSPIPYEAYPLTEDWDESTTTWTTRVAGPPWFEEGGTYDDKYKISEGEFTLSGALSWAEIDVTKAFEYWDGHPNYGIIVISKQTTSGKISFFSSETTNPNYRPYVELEYYIP